MTKKERVSPGIDLKKYKDLEGLSLQKINFGLWLALNRKKIIKAFVIFLIIFSAITFVYSTYNYIFYFFNGRNADLQLGSDLAKNILGSEESRINSKPSDLNVGESSVFLVQGKYDFLVLLENLNNKHLGSFNYCFQDASGEEVACGNDFILPSSKKYLLVAGRELKSNPTKVKFILKNIFWQRLDTHEIPDWAAYAAPRLNFVVSDIKYSKQEQTAKVSFHNLSFKIKNNSSFHYKRLPLNIVLFNGVMPSGLNVYSLDNFLSSESREISVSWPAGLESVSRVEVTPNINILDEESYLPYRGEIIQ